MKINNNRLPFSKLEPVPEKLILQTVKKHYSRYSTKIQFIHASQNIRHIIFKYE